MFQVGDAVVHPVRGAGVVTEIEELQRGSTRRQYYRIRLLGQGHTSLMIPVKTAETVGLRRPMQQSRLDQVRHVLCGEPDTLPADYRQRHRLLEDRIQSGDTLQIARAVRDIDWWKQCRKGLSQRERGMYRRALKRLAGEIASAEGIALAQARSQVRTWLKADPSPEEESDTESQDRNPVSLLSSAVRKGVSICRQIASGGEGECQGTSTERS